MGDSGSNDVTIKLKHKNWEIEIRCAEPKVKEVVERVLSSIDTSLTNESTDEVSELRREIDSLKSAILSIPRVSDNGVSKSAPVSDKGGKTCRGLLQSLWFEAYFGSERSLGEVHEELARRGYNYDRTAVSHSLTDMVREGILTRLGSMRNYRYIQKRPASDSSEATVTL